MRARETRQSGSLKLSNLLLLAILAVAVYVGVQAVPAEYHNDQLQNRLAQEARIASYYNADNAHIRSRVLADAQQLDLPLSAPQIRIERTGGAVTIQIQYSVPIQIPFYRWQLNFTDNSASAL